MPERRVPILAPWQRKLAGQVSRFVGVGVVNTGISYGSFLAFLTLLGGNPAPGGSETWQHTTAYCLGYAVATACAYILHAKITFRVNVEGNIKRSGSMFVVIQIAMACLGAGLLDIGIRLTGWDARLLWLLAGLIVCVVNFMLTKFFVFRA